MSKAPAPQLLAKRRMRHSINRKLLKQAAITIGFLSVAIWCAVWVYVMSWEVHRPLAPDPGSGRVYLFADHGIEDVYVSAQDLFWLHFGIGSAIALFVIAIGCGYAANRFSKPQP